jgi:hypothetical protein
MLCHWQKSRQQEVESVSKEAEVMGAEEEESEGGQDEVPAPSLTEVTC